jgi:F0F1-type ATP synthase membrane subunit a
MYFIQNRPESSAAFILKSITKTLITTTTETLGSFDLQSFNVSFSLFLFAFSCTLVSLIPHIEEATRDINTTFAIALISFCFIQYKGFQAHGLHHLKEYVQPFFFMLPMHLIGDVAKITSMSFRLFGNILAGSVILQLMFMVLSSFFPYLAGYLLILITLSGTTYLLKNHFSFVERFQSYLQLLYLVFLIPAGLQLFFGLFEGLLQSGVIALLTLTYTGLVTQKTEEAH